MQNYNTVAEVGAVAVAVAATVALIHVVPNAHALNNWPRDVQVMNFLASPHSYDLSHWPPHCTDKRVRSFAKMDSMDSVAWSCAFVTRPAACNIQTMMPVVAWKTDGVGSGVHGRAMVASNYVCETAAAAVVAVLTMPVQLEVNFHHPLMTLVPDSTAALYD